MEREKKDPEDLFKERLERLERAIHLKEPDRVPIILMPGFLPQNYLGISYARQTYDDDAYTQGVVKFASDFDADMTGSFPGLENFIMSLALIESHPDIAPSVRFLTGGFHDALHDRYSKWPGRELPENGYPQFPGGEFMKREEYDKLIEDPLGFINGTLFPRVYKSLEKPDSAEAYGAMMKVGIAAQKFGALMNGLTLELRKTGFPSFPMGYSYSPLDIISDFMRHETGAILDIRRVPDKVKEAAEVLTPLVTKVGLVSGKVPPEVKKALGTDIVLCFAPLHLNSFLSPKLYNEFYWPYLKKVMEEVIKAGMISFNFYEGDQTPHLETMREIQRGKAIAFFERPDFKKVKDILGGHTCIMGGVSGSLLTGGTPEKVEEYVKKVLEELMPGGGFILSVGEGSSLDVKPENLRAMVKTVEKYGRY